MTNYTILGSSSTGNSIIYRDKFIVDVGLPYSKIKPHLDGIEFILLTHKHGDHFNKSTLKSIGKEYPNILLCVPEGMIEEVEKLDYQGRIFVLSLGSKYRFYNGIYIETFTLFHDVPNVGYKIIDNGFKIVHATDTKSIDHVEAKDYDIYAIEHNHDEEILMKQIDEKIKSGEYSHEIRSRESHLSFQKAQDWILSQKKDSSEIIMLHISSSYLEE